MLAQNGWFVLRSLLPRGRTGKLITWTVEPNAIPNWIREPNIGFSQIGYIPEQPKVAVIELGRYRIWWEPTRSVLPTHPSSSSQPSRKAMRLLFNIPENETIMAVISLGYRDGEPTRPGRRPLDDIVEFF